MACLKKRGENRRRPHFRSLSCKIIEAPTMTHNDAHALTRFEFTSQRKKHLRLLPHKKNSVEKFT